VTAGLVWLYASITRTPDDAYVAGDLISVMSQVNGTVARSTPTDRPGARRPGAGRLDATDAGIACRMPSSNWRARWRQTRRCLPTATQLAAVAAHARRISTGRWRISTAARMSPHRAVSAEELGHGATH